MLILDMLNYPPNWVCWHSKWMVLVLARELGWQTLIHVVFVFCYAATIECLFNVLNFRGS